MKILINTPVIVGSGHGGVANFYYGLKPFWKEKVKYNYIGKRNTKKGSGVFWLPWDIVKYINRLIFLKPDIVLLNPSLNRNAIIRDMIFLKIGVFFHIKVGILIHGWEDDYANSLNKNSFSKTINKSAFILVLANQFKQQLISWGVTKPIELSSAKVDDLLLKQFEINKRTGKCETILFLSRLVKRKGIYESIEAFSILKKESPNLKLRIVGTGDEYKSAVEYVSHKDIRDVSFTSFIPEEQMPMEFMNADFYLFPTYYGEGMPTSVLEAMAFGLPVLTRPVGGLADFFKDGEMGILTESKDPQVLADSMKKLIYNKEKMKEISNYNYNYIKNHFLASIVANNLESVFRKYQ